MTGSPRRLLGTALLVAAFGLTACSSGGDKEEATPTTAAPASTTTAAGESPTTAAPTVGQATDAGLELPRTVTYAGVELSVTGATWSNTTPASFGQDTPIAGDTTRLYLELTTGYPDDYPGSDAVLPAANFVLENGTGDRLPATGAGDTASGEIPVRTAGPTTVVLGFELAEDDLENATLVYDDGEHVAVALPLVGDLPDLPYPAVTEVGETQTPELPTGCDPQPADVELVTATWDLDGGVGVDGKRLAGGRSSRTAVAHHFLRAEVHVTAKAGACGGTFATHEEFRVLADTEELAPINSPSLDLDDGQEAPLIFLFEVPDDADELSLQAGDPKGTTVSFDLPDRP